MSSTTSSLTGPSRSTEACSDIRRQSDTRDVKVNLMLKLSPLHGTGDNTTQLTLLKIRAHADHAGLLEPLVSSKELMLSRLDSSSHSQSHYLPTVSKASLITDIFPSHSHAALDVTVAITMPLSHGLVMALKTLSLRMITSTHRLTNHANTTQRPKLVFKLYLTLMFLKTIQLN